MTFTPAKIAVGTGEGVPVQFNPASLRVTTTNQLDDAHANQVSKPTSFKLDVELLFDSTEDGSDIYRKTRAIRDAATSTARGAAASRSSSGSSGSGRSRRSASHLELVTFTWGTTIYQGYIESLNETLDYWSSDGVPMRSTIQISIKGTTENFLTGEYKDLGPKYLEDPAPKLLEIVPSSTASDQKRFTATATAAGDTSTGRGIAAFNGVENMRSGAFAGASASASAGATASAGAGASAGGGAMVAAGAGAQLQAAAGFKLAGGVSAGASAGFGMGAGAGLSAGAGLGGGVGIGMAAGAGVGGGMSAGVGIGAAAGFGAGASAGFAGGAGASIAGVTGLGAGVSAGMGMGGGFGGSSGGGFGMTTSTSVTGFDGVTRSSTTTTTTGFDGVTRTTSSNSQSSGASWGSPSVGIPASAGAFAGLGTSRTTLPGTGFNPDLLLPPPLPVSGTNTIFDISGRAVSGNGQVAASYSARAGVIVW